MKLWDKGYTLDQEIELFMTGDDPALDEALIPYDCLGSMAHAKMLAKIGILSDEECKKLLKELHQITLQARSGTFTIRPEDEDVHTAVENALTMRLGDVGKKLHTARSRNDQILLDLRLYSREQIMRVGERVTAVCETLLAFAKKHSTVPIPGRTHFQRAMPSSLGLWAGAFAESLLDDLEHLKQTYTLTDQCPLGSAASYGTSLPIDRAYVADLLGFRCVQNNVLYVNNSRGKFESMIVHALAQIMNDLAKLSSDIIIFSAPEFGYLLLPERFCSGSSLMPQKRNPCPFELIRAKSATVQSALFQILETIRSLPSGYNRDFQETKRPLMQSFETTWLSLGACERLLSGMGVDRERCLQAFSPELFATDQALALVQSGVPFRDAYRQIGLNPSEVRMEDPIKNIFLKTHQGATGNLGLDVSVSRLAQYKKWIDGETGHHRNCNEKFFTLY